MYLFFCNTGARHRIVYNVRLVLQRGERRVTVPIGQWVKTVKPQDDESSLTAAGGDYARAFAIAPRATFEQASIFKSLPTAERWLNEEGIYLCAIEALVDRRWRQPAWKTLTTFNVTLAGPASTALREESGRWVNAVTEAARSCGKGAA